MGPAAALTQGSLATDRAATREPGTLLPRLVLGSVMAASIVAGLLATDAAMAAHAASDAGADLTRLLRAMAVLKALMAAAAASVVFWRASSPISPAWCLAYALTLAAMGAGPGLIWTMAHVACGALLLHGGLIATALLLWRDPAVATRLSALVAARRRRHAAP